MIDAEETKRFKAKQLRYKKPIVKNLNMDSITQDLALHKPNCETEFANYEKADFQ